MIKPILLLFLVLMLNTKERNCDSIKNGIFYFYPPDGSEPYQIIRKDSIQEEINLKTLDTSFWKIKWSDDCTATLHIVRTTKKIEEYERAFLFGHSSIMQVLSISDKYYIFRGALDSLNSQFKIVDTIWFTRK